MVFKTGAFQISPNMTPDQVANKRAMIAALLPKFGSAKYVGEGIGQLATGVMAGRQGRKLDEIEGKGTASANSLWERLMGTANSAQSPDMGPLSVLGPTDPWVAGAEAPAGPDPTKTYLGMPDVAEGGLSFPGQPKVTPEGSSGLSFGSNVGQSSGGSAEAIFRETLLAGGLPAHAVEGIMMNAHDESAFNPNAVGDSGAAFGMLQWNGPRKRALEKFAAENGENPADPAVQAKFTLYELQGPESAAGRALLAAGTAGEAGAAFVNHYERPAESHRARREAAYLGGGGRTAGSGGSSAGAAATAPTSAPSIPINELYMALQNPWLSGEQKGLITSMIQEQQQASDPLYQLQLAQAQADLAKSTAPAGPPEELTTRMALAENAGLERGTPEYQHYMLTGELPEAAEPGYRTMTADEAKQLGLPPGAYQMGPNGEIKAIGGGGVNVSVDTGGGSPDLGKLSTDYGYLTNPDGTIKRDPVTGLAISAPVPGSPAALEAERLKKAEENAGGISNTTSDTIISAATRANDANNERLVGGVFGALAAYNPSTPNAEVYRQTDALKSIASIENITAMRKASPTGAALGAASDKDIELLKNKHGALDPASPNYKRDLMDYTRALLRTVHGDEAGDAIFEQTFGAAESGTTEADGWKVMPNGVKVRVKQ